MHGFHATFVNNLHSISMLESSWQQFICTPYPQCSGQALGPLGIQMAQFTKEFNDRSAELYEMNTPLTVELKAFSDRTFTFDIRSPPTSWLIKQAIGMKMGPNSPSPAEASGYITPEAVYQIAQIKQADENRWHLPLEGIAKSVLGTARSMGVQVAKPDQKDEVDASSEEKQS